jgi:hypothetical protein
MQHGLQNLLVYGAHTLWYYTLVVAEYNLSSVATAARKHSLSYLAVYNMYIYT